MALSKIAAAFALVLSLCAAAVAGPVAPHDFVRADGKRLVTSDGRAFLVKGINLAHWLLPEGYMFGFNRKTEAPDQIRRTFARLLGDEGAAEFWTRFLDEFVGEDDIRFIAAAGFNTVRVPFDYRMFVAGGADPKFEGRAMPCSTG